MTIMSRLKVGGSSRSVESFHRVRAYSGVLGFLLLFPRSSMAVGAWVGLKLLNTVLSLAVESSSAYLPILSSVFLVVKRSMLK
jgi:hypothetical protein